ncbi:MAG: SoxR reducing system RseC family protein, partial [Clostridia bacterium]|nr:SoxR reducing system RseC family protein [Clostridia bacterium]
MTGSARVRSVSADGKNAVVETERKSACEGCHKGAEGCDACSLLGPNGKISCPAVNAAGASVGDTVEIESSSRRKLLYAA